MELEQKKLKIAFVHPDLGIGGAERLIVDAGMALKNSGHEVTMYTSHHDKTHCFKETLDDLTVNVQGDFLPQSIFGYGHIICAILRGLYLSLYLLFNKRNEYDIIIADQLATYIPILKFTKSKILFYCHFPDMKLASRNSTIKKLYRIPFDLLEEYSTKMADKILVNSQFTRSIFKETFTKIDIIPEVLYPSINTKEYEKDIDESDKSLDLLKSDKITLLSINRFEKKKNLGLNIKTFKELKEKCSEDEFKNIRLVIAGGYDLLNSENVEYHKELEEIAKANNFTYQTIWPNSMKKNEIKKDANIIFLLSFSENQRTYLLKHSNCLLYTPTNEHFGIVPVEAMYSGLPVIAINSGGPKESVVPGKTGFLCPSDEKELAEASYAILYPEKSTSTKYQINVADMPTYAKEYVFNKFGFDQFKKTLNSILYEMYQHQKEEIQTKTEKKEL
ncbi:UDP-Glycosyltransferase/glycogen phosphorylase [Piromyces finnis]|uniref:Alpha-1,3/1,6-mannosyltransferase ALG2 n=1 Tax=Piromyces finnis TaxID=1754191 RepID=A0A1Y1VJ91_9FUNG|nr:UDP-Glycosyltransferase/glycogen phosphorylase [Piromyces finnis]|eukprot:ORX57091.1 UDP-Glycosyltransferase/glycogen phosphorylase [Piromyces finnis]